MGIARILPATIAATAVAVADQLTKAGAVVLRCGPARCPARNSELMLGLAGGAPWAVVALTVAGLGAWFAVTATVRRRGHVPQVVDGLVVGGALGNLIDRVALGYVRDFIPMPFNTVANVADLSVYAGLAAVIVLAVLPTARASERR